MRVDLYAKIRRGRKRQAIGRLSYGGGSRGPDHLVEYPAAGGEFGHDLVTLSPRPLGRRRKSLWRKAARVAELADALDLGAHLLRKHPSPNLAVSP